MLLTDEEDEEERVVRKDEARKVIQMNYSDVFCISGQRTLLEEERERERERERGRSTQMRESK